MAATVTEPREITEDEFTTALEVLPPAGYQHARGWCRFHVAEFITGTLAHQYLAVDGRYYTKVVDVLDNDTWLRPNDFRGKEASTDTNANV